MNDMWDSIVSILGVCAVAAVLTSPVTCTMHRDAKMAEAIKAGADPVAVRCAMTDDFYTPICMMREAGKK